MRIVLPRSRRGALLALAALAVVALGLAATAGFDGWLSPPSVTLETVERGRFRRAVAAEGTLEAVKATPIVVPTELRRPQKIAWLAPQGGELKAGEPVVLFDPYDAEKLLVDGQADRRSAEMKIRRTEAESESGVRGLTIDREIAGEEMARAESFAPKDRQVFSRNEIIESEIDRDLLASRLEAAEAKAGSSAKRASAEIALSEIEKRKAEIRIREAERGLASLRVLAPHDGFFSMERNWRGQLGFSAGDSVWPGQKIGEIPDLSALEAKVFVLEADAGGLKPGSRATVVIEGRAGPGVAATVQRVDAIAKTRDWRVPTKYFETILSLERTDPELMKPGQTVRATIVLEELEEVLAVPRQAVFERDDRRVVYRMSGGRLEPVEVKVGRHSLSHVVIEEGLEPGDRIALRDPTKTVSDIFGGDGAGAGETAPGAAEPR